MTKFALLCAALLLALAGCAQVAPEHFRGPGGHDAYVMKCSGFGRTLAQCYAKAGEVCPAGYHVISQTSGVVGIPYQGGTMMAPRESLVIECRGIAAR